MSYLGLFLGFLFLIACGAAFRDRTGVNMPTRSAMKGIRRTAKKAGISEAQAFDNNISRKQKALFDPPKKRRSKHGL
jgi:hypothetical protein